MALGDPYVELARLKDYLKIKPDKIEQEDNLRDAILSASGEIEKHCNRQFNKADTATARVYEPEDAYTVSVDDFWSTDDLVVEVDSNGDGTFSTVVPASDYEVYPRNGVVDGQIGWPYYELQFVEPLPCGRRKGIVRVTAKRCRTGRP